MTGATGKPTRDAEDGRGEQNAESERCASAGSNAAPLPGVMDFVGAHVGGELAEERWR